MIEFEHYLEPEYRIDGTRDVIMGKTDIMLRLFHYLNHLASLPTTVLLQGETGTGKELCARALHHNGNNSRKAYNFVTINCAGIPSELLESELFGYAQGAFTGAYKSTPGKFRHAHKGTILLDEISEIQGTEGILLTFDDFVQGVEDFGQRIQPLMKCREHIVVEADAPRVVLEKSA